MEANTEHFLSLCLPFYFLVSLKKDMGTLIINNRTFVVIEQKEFDRIQLTAAQKTTPVKKLSLAAGKKYSLKLIDKWAKGK